MYQIYLNGRNEPYATADSLYWVERILDELAEEYVIDYDLSVIECGYVHVTINRKG